MAPHKAAAVGGSERDQRSRLCDGRPLVHFPPMPEIHPTSLIEDGATLADGVRIGPFCHIGPKVTLGRGTRLLSHVSITGRTTLGEGNTVWPGAVLGGTPQDLKYRGEDSQLLIGDHNDLRECVTLHLGTDNDAGVTRVGSHNLIMAYVHVGHDCVIGSHCVIANGVQLAGHILIEDHVGIGGASAVHHFCTIAEHAFIGGMTRVVKDAPPYFTTEGNPAQVRSVNRMGLKRRGFTDDQLDHLQEAFRRLYKQPPGPEKIVIDTRGEAEILHQLYPDDPCIQTLLRHVHRTLTGSYGRYRESQRKDNRYANPVK